MCHDIDELTLGHTIPRFLLSILSKSSQRMHGNPNQYTINLYIRNRSLLDGRSWLVVSNKYDYPEDIGIIAGFYLNASDGAVLVIRRCTDTVRSGQAPYLTTIEDEKESI